jgi:hypothetical protein
VGRDLFPRACKIFEEFVVATLSPGATFVAGCAFDADYLAVTNIANGICRLGGDVEVVEKFALPSLRKVHQTRRRRKDLAVQEIQETAGPESPVQPTESSPARLETSLQPAESRTARPESSSQPAESRTARPETSLQPEESQTGAAEQPTEVTRRSRRERRRSLAVTVGRQSSGERSSALTGSSRRESGFGVSSVAPSPMRARLGSNGDVDYAPSESKQPEDKVMYNYELEEALVQVGESAMRKLRADREALADDRLKPVLAYVEENLLKATFSTQEALKAADMGTKLAARRLCEALGMELKVYVDQLLLQLAAEVSLANPGIPLGRAAARVGKPAYTTNLRFSIDRYGHRPALTRTDRRMQPELNYVFFHKKRRGVLSPQENATLLAHVIGLYPGGLGQAALGQDTLGQATRAPTPQTPQLAVNVDDDDDEALVLAGCNLGAVSSKLWPVVRQGIRDTLERTADDRRFLSARQLRLFCDFEQHLFEPRKQYTVAKALKKLGIPSKDVQDQIAFQLGDSMQQYNTWHRIYLGAWLHGEAGLHPPLVAEMVGLSIYRYREQFQLLTGERPCDMRDAPPSPISYKPWHAVGIGHGTPTEVITVVDWLQDDAKDSKDSCGHGVVSVEVSTASAAVAATQDVVAIDFDWTEMRRTAMQLSPINAKAACQESERILAASPEAPRLYQLREIQSIVAAAEALERGEKPMSELYARWLKVRRKPGCRDEAPVADWLAVVSQLPEPNVALDYWAPAEELRGKLMRMSKDDRKAAIQGSDPRTGSPFQNYLVLRACLFAEEHFHRLLGPFIVEEMQAAVLISEMLTGGTEETRKKVAGVLVEGEIFSRARLGNAMRMHSNVQLGKGSIEQALGILKSGRFGPYVEGETAAIYAALLRDEGRDLPLAEECCDHAIKIFSSFDPYMAARETIVKAAIQRLRSNDSYVTTLVQGQGEIDRWRNPAVLQTVEKNLFYYLVLEGYFTEARRQQGFLPRPTIEALLASRLCVDGCLDLAVGHIDSAELLFHDCADRFTGLQRLSDTELPLLYIAVCRDYKGDLEGRQRHLIAAAQIARTYGFAEAPAIEQLIRDLADESHLAERILAVAVEAGGCLGPKAEARDY